MAIAQVCTTSLHPDPPGYAPSSDPLSLSSPPVGTSRRGDPKKGNSYRLDLRKQHISTFRTPPRSSCPRRNHAARSSPWRSTWRTRRCTSGGCGSRARQQQCHAVSHRQRPEPPVEGGRPRCGDGTLRCPAQRPGAPAPLAVDGLIGINSHLPIDSPILSRRPIPGLLYGLSAGKRSTVLWQHLVSIETPPPVIHTATAIADDRSNGKGVAETKGVVGRVGSRTAFRPCQGI